MVDDKTEVIAEIFRLFADSGNLPTVIHCSNGTARTGFVSALLLAALGVPEDTVVADYTLSNLNYDHFYAEAQEKVRILSIFGVTADDLQPMILSQPKTMQGVFDHIRQQYGSLETYLSETVGLDDETIARLRNNLLY